jgi:tryptophan synthase alpha chain
MGGREAIGTAFRRNGGRTLIPYVMAGDPDLETTGRLLRALDESGADLLEVGIPFSDPLADGPTIQAAGIRSLAAGTDLAGTLGLLRSLAGELRAPRVLMSYANPLLCRGVERFAAEAAEAEVSGVIVPDLPFEESGPWAKALRHRDVVLIRMAAPNSTEGDLAAIGAAAEGFLYCVSILGTTGNAARLAERATAPDGTGGLERYLARVRRQTSVPRALGFGIDGPERVRALGPLAEGLVVGSALVEQIAEAHREGADPVPRARTFFRSLREARDG